MKHTLADPAFVGNVQRHRYPLSELDIGDVTFQAGQREAVHRWYRLTPSFAPALVRHFLTRWNATPGSLVLDPFSGRGTTLIECQKQGIPALGFEINPLLQTVAAHSLLWRPRRSRRLADFLTELDGELAQYRNDPIERVLSVRDLRLPVIHNVYRWWRPAVLRDLLLARRFLRMPRYASVFSFLWLALNAAALDCANIHRNHPTITFDDDHGRDLDVRKAIRTRLGEIADDLRGLTPTQVSSSGLGRVELRDARAPFRDASGDRRFTHVLTSPPYPNRFSYVHQTRPQLYFMELLDDPAAATTIDLQTIGGTWGRATSDLLRGPIDPPPHLAPLLPYVEELRRKSVLMCNYATRYFVDLDTHLGRLREAAEPGLRGAYIVGNSRLAGVEIFTETVLARLLERQGFTLEELILFRKRGGKKRLYETAVCFRL